MPRPTVIFAVDIATVVGFATAAMNEVPIYGSQRMGRPGCEPEDCGVALELWLNQQLDQYDPEYFIFEAPLAGFGRGGAEVPYRLTGMAFLAAVTARKRNLRIYKVETSTVTKFFTGKGRWGSSAEKKRETIAACRRYGWDPKDDNAADGLAILAYAQSIIGRGTVSQLAGPLFQPLAGAEVSTSERRRSVGDERPLF